MAGKPRRRKPPATAVDRAVRSAKRTARSMTPDRVVARFLSGGRHQTIGAIARAPFKEHTVATPKSGKRRYQQIVAKERKAQAKKAAETKRAQAAAQRAVRAQTRGQKPRAPRPQRQPIAVNPRTGKAITWGQAQAGVRAAQREVDRIERELAGAPAPRPRAPRPKPEQAPASKSPLQAAIAEVKAKQKPPDRTPAKPKPRKKAAAKPRRPLAKKNSGIETVADLIPGRAILAPTTPQRATPGAPTAPYAIPLSPRSRAARKGGKGVYGAVLRRTCECGGTGRIPTYDPKTAALTGSASCPVHGRRARGTRRHFTRTAARDAGLPGLAGYLEKKRRNGSKRLDKQQERVQHRAATDLRRMGPTVPCPQTAHCDNGIWDRKDKDREREAFIAAHVAAARAEDQPVPSNRRLRKLAAQALPYEHCDTCGGLGRVPTSTEVTQDGQIPVWEWRTGAGLRYGHQPTARERSTGRRQTEHAERVERRRKLPRL